MARETVKIKNSYFNSFLNDQPGSPLQTLKKKEFPVKTAYWIARGLDKLTSEANAYNQERLKLLNKHSKKDKDGKPQTFSGGRAQIEDMAAWEKDFTELQDIEIEVELVKIDIDDPANTASFTMEEMEVLMPLLNIEEE